MDAVDLDARRAGHARRRCGRPTTSSASTRSGSTTPPTRRTSTARSQCRRSPPRRSSRRSTRRWTRYDQSTVGTLMERKLVDWTCGRIGFAAGDGVFTSGGTQSNLQALLHGAGDAIAGARGSVDAARRLVILATASSHFSVQKSARLLGLGDDVGPARRDRRARPDGPRGARRRARHRSRRSTGCPCASSRPPARPTGAGSTLSARSPTSATAAGVWLHVDAAYGCGLLVSPTRRHLLDGIERARSVTVDFHKSFFQPVSSSAVLVRRPADLRHVTWHADYLNPADADGAEPGGQVAADDPPVRRAQALDHAARARRGRHRRDVRRGPGPGRAGARRDRARRRLRAGRSHRAQHRPVPVPAGRRHGRAGRPPGAAGAARAVRVGARGRRQDRGGRAAVPQAHAANPRPRSTTCARCSTWSAARVRRWSRATTWSLQRRWGAGPPRRGSTTSSASASGRSTSGSPP